MAIFFTADQHFGHCQIIEYEGRQFDDIDHMHQVLILNWNKVVGPNDLVYVVGDFSVLNEEKTRMVLQRLNGKKHLIMGNHDKDRDVQWWLGVGFERVFEHPIIIEDFLILSHEPIYMNKAMPYLNLHGHLHSQRIIHEEAPRYYNVSVELHDYTPVNLERIKKEVAPWYS